MGTAGGVATILVVGVIERGLADLREHLGSEALLPASSIRYDEAPEAVRRTRPTVVVVGFDLDGDAAVETGARLAQTYDAIQMVAMSGRSDPMLIRAAMRAGYREFVVLPEDAPQLRQAVADATLGAAEDPDRGQLIAFCGSKGGVGTTALAINLAAELAPVYRTLVADLDFSMGDVAAFLDLQAPSDVSRVLASLDRLDERMLSGSVAVHPTKLHVLAQPRELDDHTGLRGDAILRLLTVCSRSYQYVLLDCGGHIDEATLTTMSAADLVFLICTPDVPAVKNAWRRLQLLDRVGIDRDRVRLIVNKYDRKSVLRVKDIEANLGIRVASTVSLDEKTLSTAVNDGRLVREVNNRSPASRDISDLINLVTDDDEVVEHEPQKSGIMKWFS